MSLTTDLQVFYPLSANTDESWNGDNATNTGLSFATHSGVASADVPGSGGRAFSANSSFNFSFGTGDFTMCAWVNPDVVNYGPANQGSVWSTGNTNYDFAIYQGMFYMFMGNTSTFRVTSGTPVTTGSWQHLMIVRSGTTVTLYYNNTQPAQYDGGSPGTANITSSGSPQFYIGDAPGASNSQYDGKVCDVLMWSRALSASEITEIYNAGAGQFSSLVGPSTLRGMFSSVVHTVASENGRLHGQFASIVHTVNAENGRLHGMFMSVVHSVPPPAAIVPDITGTPGSPATFDGSASTLVEYYQWRWVSVPGGSPLRAPFDNAPVPFPDSQATSPIDMTNNQGLWHFEGNANDTSGNSRNGTVTGASLVAGKVGAQAYQFGVADNINFGAASTFISADFSISLWLKGDAAWTPSVFDAIVGASNAFTWSEGFGAFWLNATTIRFFVGGYH